MTPANWCVDIPQETENTGCLDSQYSSPFDLRTLHLAIPCILRPDISDTTRIVSV